MHHIPGRRIGAVIFDWAGTTVDYGSFAPVNAFISAFSDFGVVPTVEETRAPMGLHKRAHIEQMLQGKRLQSLWEERHGRNPGAEDIDRIYSRFEPALFRVLPAYTDPLPGVLETLGRIREMKIKTGSTTGYTRAMMDVVFPAARDKGYSPGCVICPDETGGIGRPWPYMLWRNLEKLKVLSIAEVLKAGDTAADMEEGKNAGCLCAGVIRGSNMLGLSQEELAQKSEAEKSALFETAKQRFIKAGADYVIEDISALPALIDSIQTGKTIDA